MESFLLALAAGFAWLVGETGKTIVAGGLGGLARWLAQDKKTIGTFMIAWTGGSVCGVYLSPLVMRMLGYAPEDTTDIAASVVFLTGASGVSLLKIFIAVVETRAAKWGKD